jgi:Uma2 family endonuclease
LSPKHGHRESVPYSGPETTMNEPARKLSFTYAEYLEQEKTSGTKHEFVNGEIFAMSAGSPEHGRLAANVIGIIRSQLLGRPCIVFSSDARVRVLSTGLCTYPDMSVVCTRVELDPEDANSIINPIVLVEVLSDSTEAYDRGEKFAHYRRIPSLQEYVLVSQRKARIEVFRLNEKRSWTLYEAEAHESVELLSIGCKLSVDEVYANPITEAASHQG